MIVTNVFAGFGNQLFMYACGYAVSRRLGTQLMIDASYIANDTSRKYELCHLKIKYDKCFRVDGFSWYWLRVIIRKFRHALMSFRHSSFRENKAFEFNANILNVNNNTRLFGYWQNEKYFIDYRHELLEMFVPTYELSQSCLQLIDEIHSSNSISVHIRRGDYVKIGICLGMEYYEKAIAYIKGKVDNPVFYVFSDDKEYADDLFKKMDCDYKIVEYEPVNSSIDDIFVMKECKHNIVANSSYSWWGAWLNNNKYKIVVCPYNNETDRTGFYPSEWVKI